MPDTEPHDTLHTLNWRIVPYVDGREAVASIVIRVSHADPIGCMSDKELLINLRSTAAQLLNCPSTRISLQPVPDWAKL